MADPKGFLQDLLGEAGDLIAWVHKTLQDPEARKATLLDLGLDPNENNDAAIEETSIDNIKRYRNAVDPDEAAFRSAVQDLKSFYQAVKEYIKLFGISDRVDEVAYRFVELLGTNYLRLRSPHLFYLGQVLGFVVESRLTVDGVPSRQGVLPAVAWSLLTDPLGYIWNLPGNLKKAGRPDLKTTEDAETWSLLFLSLPLLLRETDSDADMRFLYNWDRLPRTFAADNKTELRASFHGTRLLERVRNDFPGVFSPADTEGAWAKIEAAAAAGQPSEIQKQVRSAYLTTVERWKRGEWVDLVSETAFSFDFRLPDSDSGVEKFLGGSLFFVSREDVPTDIGTDDLITNKLSGGLFASLNGELNVKEPLGDDWEFVLKTSSGDVLDVFLSEASDLNAVGDMRIEVGLNRKPDPDTGASYNLPDASGTRFAVGGITIFGFLKKGDAGVEIRLKDNALVVSGQNADGFLQEVMPAGEVPLKFSLAGGVSRSKGFYFNHDIGVLNDLLGTGDDGTDPSIAKSVSRASRANEEEEAKKRALDIKFPIHAQTGPARFESVDWSYGKTRKKDALGARLAATVTLSSKLGPVYARVEGIGVALDISMPPPGSDLTTSAVDFGFVPPKGVGLRIDAAAVSGGGFLEFDPDNHRYAGIATLKFLELELSAVGLINTRLPNNQPGFSLLLCISVIFEPAYRLPYLFTLEGVGGLIGVNRTMKIDVLRERIRDGAINSIMFPANIVENAAKIISDLRAIFPPQAKHFVVAPFLKIGWGAKTVLEVDLGIFIEFPFKGRLILLGALSICLPDKKADPRLVDLRVDIFGDFNFAESYVLIEGRLRDGSHVAGIPLAGGFAFVLDWGNDPQFLLSVGGYHPRYQKPPRFPDIARLSAQIKRGDAVRLTCLYYQAITSNTFQIGFSADLLVKKGNATAIGFLGFNALLQFDPLYFEVDIRISVQIAYRGRSFAGVELEFLLSGPRPWRAVGYAKIKILFFSLKIRFNESWGGEQQAVPATVAPDKLLADLKGQLGQKNNWTARLTPGFSRAEALRSSDDIDKQDRILVHPGGSLEIRQTLVPLNRSIERFGNSKVDNRPVYRIESYRLGNGPAVAVAQQDILREHFARGQFEDLPDKEKIAAADFEMMPAGIHFGAGQAFDIPTEVESSANDFEEIVLRAEPGEPGATPRVFATRAPAVYNWQVERSLNLSAARRPADANRPEEVFALLETLPDYREKDYEIVSKASLKGPADLAGRHFRTRSEALDYFKGRWGEWSAEWQIREATTVIEESLPR